MDLLWIGRHPSSADSPDGLSSRRGQADPQRRPWTHRADHLGRVGYSALGIGICGKSGGAKFLYCGGGNDLDGLVPDRLQVGAFMRPRPLVLAGLMAPSLPVFGWQADDARKPSQGELKKK